MFRRRHDEARVSIDRQAHIHADQARRQRLEELQHLAAPQLLANDNFLASVDPVHLDHFLGDIQSDRCNLHVNRSLMRFVGNDDPM
jgi:hypothetical protein